MVNRRSDTDFRSDTDLGNTQSAPQTYFHKKAKRPKIEQQVGHHTGAA